MENRQEPFRDYHMRGGLPHSAWLLGEGSGSIGWREVCVAFIGGSVTVGQGASDEETTSWRALTCRYFREKYPHVPFRFVNAAVGGTNSTYGAFRFRRDVLDGGPVDLLFVEFGVNDGHIRTESVRAMEGIVRQAKKANPKVDIVFVYTAHRDAVERFRSDGSLTENVRSHEEVAAYYGVPSVNFNSQISRLLTAGAFDWDAFSADVVHPNDFGFSLYALFMRDFLNEALNESGHSEHGEAAESPDPLDPLCYELAELVGLDALDISSGWNCVHGFAPDRTCNWKPPADIRIGAAPGDRFTRSFVGTAFGLVLLAGPDTGTIKYRIDRGDWNVLDLFDDFCKLFYRPKTVLLANELSPGYHTVEVVVSGQKHEESMGNRVHLWNIMVNSISK